MTEVTYLFLLVYRSVVSSYSEDDDMHGIDEEVEVKQVFDKPVPLVLQQPVKGFHQQHLMTVLNGTRKRRTLVGPVCAGL